MLAIVGLGNPGGRYAFTRHNAGFVLADALRERWRFERFRKTSGAEVSVGQVASQDILLMKPLTYMNLSGRAIAGLLREEEFDASQDLLVMVDEVALPLGTIRIRPRGSAGGHNGLKSISAVVGSGDYPRLRIGVGPAPEGAVDLAEFVLDEFSKSEWEEFMDLLPTLTEAVETWIEDGIDVAMNKYNTRKSE